MRRYWTEHDWRRRDEAISYKELTDIAFSILYRMPQPVGMVCGPISTGGAGSIEENMRILQAYVDILIEKGLNIFDQLPFEEPMLRILKNRNKESYDYNLLEEFHYPIFKSGLIRNLFFIPLWHTSIGTNWEYEHGQRFGMERLYMPELEGLEYWLTQNSLI